MEMYYVAPQSGLLLIASIKPSKNVADVMVMSSTLYDYYLFDFKTVHLIREQQMIKFLFSSFPGMFLSRIGLEI